MKTERTLELLEQFKRDGIRREGRGLQNVVDFQDCVMQANRAELAEFEASLDKDTRSTWLWAIFSTLDKDTALGVVKRTTIGRIINQEREDYLAEMLEREKLLYEKQEAFRLERSGLERELMEVKDRAATLEDALKDLRADLSNAQEYEEDARKFRALISILNG